MSLMSWYPSNLRSFTSTDSIFVSGPSSSSITSAPMTLTLTMQPTSKGSKLIAIMSSGSSSSNQVWGTNPYSTGKTTDDGIILSKTKASHLMLYSYLSLEPLTTSITMFNSSGGLSPDGISFQKFNPFSTPRTGKKQWTDLSFLDWIDGNCDIEIENSNTC